MSASTNSKLIALISQLKGVHIGTGTGTGTSTRASSRKRKKHYPCAWACVYACIEAILWRSKSGTIMLAWCLWKPCLILLIRLPDLTLLLLWCFGHCWSLQNAACMSHTCMTLVVAHSISHLSLWLSSSIGVSNAKVLGSIPVRIELFFLCLTLVTRQTTAYLQNLCEVWMLNITNMVQNNLNLYDV